MNGAKRHKLITSRFLTAGIACNNAPQCKTSTALEKNQVRNILSLTKLSLRTSRTHPVKQMKMHRSAKQALPWSFIRPRVSRRVFLNHHLLTLFVLLPPSRVVHLSLAHSHLVKQCAVFLFPLRICQCHHWRK